MDTGRMSEFPKLSDLSRRRREQAEAVQLILHGLGATAVQRYEQPDEGVGYTEQATILYFPLDGHVEEITPPDAA